MSFAGKYRRLVKILLDLPASHQSSRGPILINGVIPDQVASAFFECSLATVLRHRGTNAVVLFDDGRLLYDELSSQETLGHRPFSLYRTTASLSLSRLPFVRQYSQFLGPSSAHEAVEEARWRIAKADFYRSGVDLSSHVEASLVKYYRSARGLITREDGWQSTELKLMANAVLTVMCAEEVERQIGPQTVVSSHCIYSTFGPFADYFRLRDRKVVSYGLAAFKPNGVVMSAKGLAANRCDDGYFANNAHEIELSDAKDEVERLMTSRLGGDGPDIQFILKDKPQDNYVVQQVQQAAKRLRCIGLFPNVLWDASIVGGDVLFSSATEWLGSSIREVLSQPDTFVVVRSHPAELAGGVATRVSAGKIAMEAAGDQHPRVLVIPPESGLRSYALFRSLSAAAVYTGTIGLEAMWEKIPVLVGGGAPYRGQGLTIDFETKQEYLEGFAKIERLRTFQESRRDLLTKYMYMFFVLNEIPVSLFSDSQRLEVKIPDSYESLTEDPGFVHIARTILGESAHFQGWRAASVGARA